ncbi:LysM peptidoglycan-binding domain-containing protein [Jeotgalibacillus soli]|uniref:LysM domain-containing protein n=1 Tax=Jeotgalibacillus soli TaxID=889306 RepID=A0A0C2RR48_9BACL|nr:LysM peptidoglycan-binding domain-containing protein [Jeotgalibacillus soli]KIL44229.1 hypothetical protein KP78_31930 [Jeotgalibacillus soli]
MKQDPYRDQANKSRQKIDPIEKKQEKVEVENEALSRLELHSQKRTEKASQKKPFPLIRVLLASFFLLPLTVFLLYLFFFNSSSGETNTIIDQSDSYQLEQNQRENQSNQAAGDQEQNTEPADEEVEDTIPQPSEQAVAPPAEEQAEESEEKPEEEPVVEELEEVTAEEEAFVTHTVQPNETLFRITMNYLGSSNRVNEIRELNGLPSNDIQAGQILKIPSQ